MAKTSPVYECEACGQRPARWAGRCPGCGGWGTVVQVPAAYAAGSTTRGGPAAPVQALSAAGLGDAPRSLTGVEGLDRVLGGGLVAGSVVLLAGEPGIGKSTLVLQLAGALAGLGRTCLVASGEESLAQVAGRAHRLGVRTEGVSFVEGRDLVQVIEAVEATHPDVLMVDSIQTVREGGSSQVPGGVAQVRTCTDALVGLAKRSGTAIVLAGHVTKDGDLAGPRALEHAVDVVLSFEGDARSGLRVLAAGKNRFGAEGETAWFQMGAAGLTAIDPTDLLVSGATLAGAAVALIQRGRRALAVEVHALVGPAEGSGRRHATGLDPRRLHLVTAVLERAGVAIGRAEVFGASSGGVRIDDPAADLAVAAAIASAATGVPTPAGSAFVGEIALTGMVLAAPAIEQRLQAARGAGRTRAFVPAGPASLAMGIRTDPVTAVGDALEWAFRPASTAPKSLPA